MNGPRLVVIDESKVDRDTLELLRRPRDGVFVGELDAAALQQLADAVRQRERAEAERLAHLLATQPALGAFTKASA